MQRNMPASWPKSSFLRRSVSVDSEGNSLAFRSFVGKSTKLTGTIGRTGTTKQSIYVQTWGRAQQKKKNFHIVRFCRIVYIFFNVIYGFGFIIGDIQYQMVLVCIKLFFIPLTDSSIESSACCARLRDNQGNKRRQ